MLLFLVLEQLNPRGRMAMSIKLKRRIYRVMFLKLCLINEEGLPRLCGRPTGGDCSRNDECISYLTSQTLLYCVMNFIHMQVRCMHRR
jgi:hypothetical protein